MSTHLETRDLTIRFGGHVAVDSVTCAFRPGELTAIVGPNGAGKTTYFNLISGQLRASAGHVLFNGEDLTRLPASLRARRGLGRAFQLTNLFPNLTVAENIRLAVQARRGVHYEMLRVWSDRADLIARSDEVLADVALTARRNVAAAALSAASRMVPDASSRSAMNPRRHCLRCGPERSQALHVTQYSS